MQIAGVGRSMFQMFEQILSVQIILINKMFYNPKLINLLYIGMFAERFSVGKIVMYFVISDSFIKSHFI